MHWYEVALWLYWPSLWPEYIEVVQQASPRLAIYDVMQRYGLGIAARAAVVEVEAVERAGCGAAVRYWRGVAPIERWQGVTCPKQLQEVTTDD